MGNGGSTATYSHRGESINASAAMQVPGAQRDWGENHHRESDPEGLPDCDKGMRFGHKK